MLVFTDDILYKMDWCIFCSIISGKIPSIKIWENDTFIAILDAFPNTKGMTLVMPKKHYNSNVFKMEDSFYQEFMLAVKEVSNLLMKWLKVERTIMIMEWLQVDHAHVKLYPFYNQWMQNYFESGEQAKIEDLQEIAKEIQNNQ